MKYILVNFANGNQIRTSINGTDEQINKYYAPGAMFNIGSFDDDMQAVASIVFEPNQYPKAIALIGITTNTIDIITQDGG
ncbi:MAG: hypothetical protein IT245_06845, partial [Bacteroidia bacterium]|nr:hypothetical protein [Bacteroidia bacterium]